MKVLMFGWEFPPHISGGLGTACHGLTEALGNEDLEVQFVVPPLRGGESTNNGPLLNASKVIVLWDICRYLFPPEKSTVQIKPPPLPEKKIISKIRTVTDVGPDMVTSLKRNSSGTHKNKLTAFRHNKRRKKVFVFNA
jgi:hypothetical protein